MGFPPQFPPSLTKGEEGVKLERAFLQESWEGREGGREGGGDALFSSAVSLSSRIPSPSLFQALSTRLFAFPGSAICQQGSPTECLQKRQKAPGYQSVLEEPTT